MSFLPNIEFSRIAIVGVLIFAFLLFVVFRVLQKIIPALPLRINTKQYLKSYYPVFEFIVWILFLVWVIQFFWKNNQLFSIGISLILFLIILIALWFLLKDVIAGAFFRANRSFNENELIQIDDYYGQIINFKGKYIIIETKEGELVHLPYSYLIGKVITKAYPAENIRSKVIFLSVKKECPLNELIENLRSAIMLLPWSSIKKDPQIKLHQEKGDRYIFEILAYAMEEQHFYHIENYLKDKFYNA